MKNQMLAVTKNFFATLTGANRFSKENVLLLKTALMLSAVDGEVSDEEVACFKEYAETCRGYNGKSFDMLWEKALRSAGYLLLQSRFLAPDKLVALFVSEAREDFVDSLVLETREEREKALAFLEQMAQADGEYSQIERASLEALTAAVKEAHDLALAARYPRAVLPAGSADMAAIA